MRRIKKYQQGGMSNFVQPTLQMADLSHLTQASPLQNYIPEQAYKAILPKAETVDVLNNAVTQGGGSILGGAADLFSQYKDISSTTYNTKSGANKATAINVMKGAVTGAAAGSVFGPVGTAVGAVVGSIPGVVGNKSSVAKNGYYADPDMKYGTGILGSKTRGAAKREYDERMREVAGNRVSAVTGAYNQALWNSEFDAENQLFAANGGNISDLAWVDDGEVLMTPDESIYKVPERNQPEDNNLVSIPEGTKILSDKLKVPGTKETFANMAKKLQSRKGKYNDKYAQGSAEANAINDKIVFDTLFNMQESMKNGKKEYKKGLQEFQGGGKKESYQLGDRTGNWATDALVNFFEGFGNQAKDPQTYLNAIKMMVPTMMWYDTYNGLINRFNNSSKNNPAIKFTHMKSPGEKTDWQFDENALDANTLDANKLSENILPEIVVTPKRRQPITGATNTKRASVPASPKLDISQFKFKPDIEERTPSNVITDEDRMFAAVSSPIENVAQNTSTSVPTRTMQTDNDTQELPDLSKRRFTIGTPNFSNLATNLASLYGPISDLSVTPEVFNPVFNPYERAVVDLMGRRRYDIQPTINALRRANASANYAASQLNTNTGANLAFRLQNALRTNSAINEAYANAALQNNQYTADYANTLNQIGANRAQIVDTTNMRNAQNRATARNIVRNARNAIGQWAQVQQQMRNQRNFDSAMMDLYRPFLESGFRTEDYNKLIRQYSR